MFQVASCKEYEWFEQLLQQLLKTDDKSAVKVVLDVCQMMVDCLVESLLTLDETAGESVFFNIHTYTRPHSPGGGSKCQFISTGDMCEHSLSISARPNLMQQHSILTSAPNAL